MTVESVILIIVICILAACLFHVFAKLNALEYRVLLLTEAFAETQGKEGEELSKQIRAEINKKHWFLDTLAQRQTES